MGVCKKALKPMFKNDKWHILRGDTVKMLCGKDKDEVGTVLRVIRDEKIPRVVVSGLNLVSNTSQPHMIPTAYWLAIMRPRKV